MQEVRIGDCVLIHGDCRDMLSKMGRVDAVVTDPPYGIGQAAGMGAAVLIGLAVAAIHGGMRGLGLCPPYCRGYSRDSEAG